MEKLLVTGFEPFGNDKTNPSFQAVSRLPDVIAGLQVIKKELPVSFEKAGRKLEELIEKYQPVLVICTGLAASSPLLRMEKAALNMQDARIADNDGFQPCFKPVRENGNGAYFSPLCVKRMVQAVNHAGIKAEVSFHAGTFVCNTVFYELMHLIHTQNLSIKGGFIHVPADRKFCGKAAESGLGLDEIACALAAAIEQAALYEEDLDLPAAYITQDGGKLSEPKD